MLKLFFVYESLGLPRNLELHHLGEKNLEFGKL